MRQFFGYYTIGSATLFGLFFAVIGTFVAIVHSSNVNQLTEIFDHERAAREKFEVNERSEREKFQNDLKERVIGKNADANILLKLGEEALEGQDVEGRVLEYWPKPENWDRENMAPYVRFLASFVLAVENASDFFAGNAAIVIYIRKPIACSDCSPIAPDGRTNYDYVGVVRSAEINNLPGQAKLPFRVTLPLFKVPEQGFYPMMIRIYYGQGKIAPAQFRVYFDGTFIPHEEVVITTPK
jgi:hypothetical protein